MPCSNAMLLYDELLELDIMFSLNDKIIEMIEDCINVEAYKYKFKSEVGKSASALMKVQKSKIEFAIEKQGCEVTKEVIEILKVETEDACLVGGAVRDAILGKSVNDFDFATSRPISFLIKPFEQAGFKVQKEGLEFLVLIVSKNGTQTEIANFRTDSVTSDGRRPESVEVGTITEDGERRDFTINAMFFNIITGEILDPTNKGIDDILTNTLRFVGKPEDRIREDYIRAWRFMRFVKRGFNPDKKSNKAVKTMFKEVQEKANPARVMTELIKMGVL